MQKVDVRVEGSEFRQRLTAEINRKNKISRNAKAFVIDRKLVEIKITDIVGGIYTPRREELLLKNISEQSLPTEAFYGIVFAIKNNSIIEFYNYFPTESRNLFRPPETYYKGVVTVHNLDIADVADYTKSVNQFIDMDEYISYSIDSTINFLIAFVKFGFKLYKCREVGNVAIDLPNEFVTNI